MYKTVAFFVAFLIGSFAIAKDQKFYVTNKSGRTIYIKVSNKDCPEWSDWKTITNGTIKDNFYTATSLVCNKGYWEFYIDDNHKKKHSFAVAGLNVCDEVTIDVYADIYAPKDIQIGCRK